MKDRRHVLALSVVLLGFAHLGANCVDGVTPDCNDPNVQCGSVSFGGEAGADVIDSSSTLPDSSKPQDAGTDADARDAADADGG